jgi:hypothetical protein
MRLSFVCLLLVACSGSSASAIGSASNDISAPPLTPTEPGSAPTPPAAPRGGTIYAHTDTALYELDPTNMAAPMKSLGDFDCIGKGGARAMTDIAVAKDGTVYGVSAVAVYPLFLEGPRVRCEASWPLPSGEPFFGLTVAPEGTLEPREVLVAANVAGELFRIDETTGAATEVGSFGADPATGRPWLLSGDIVFLANGGSPLGFATVRTCETGQTNCSTTDTLIEIDVKKMAPGAASVTKSVRGAITRGSWCTNDATPASFGGLFGIAAFEDKVYGFSRRGQIVEMRNADGSACLAADFGNVAFAGAGVATNAPVRAPASP